MRILVAPDKFKGSLTAQEVAATISRAIHSVDPGIEVDLFRSQTAATTFGTGIQIGQLSEAGVSRILVGLGGSATSDAGLGMAAALGYKF
jgi:glycerate kinase